MKPHIGQLSAEHLFGIGSKTSVILREKGIEKIHQLSDTPLDELRAILPKYPFYRLVEHKSRAELAVQAQRILDDTAGKVTCSGCQGAGSLAVQEEVKESCPPCGGAGKMEIVRQTTCAKCSGVGEVRWKELKTCSSCRGNGSTTITRRSSCSACEGHGIIKVLSKREIREKCPRCLGTGIPLDFYILNAVGFPAFPIITLVTELLLAAFKNYPECDCTKRGTKGFLIRFVDEWQEQTCSHCGGTGQVDEQVKAVCGLCGGVGKVVEAFSQPCTVCERTGMIISRENVKCAACNGKGGGLKTVTSFRRCQDCGGEGFVSATKNALENMTYRQVIFAPADALSRKVKMDPAVLGSVQDVLGTLCFILDRRALDLLRF